MSFWDDAVEAVKGAVKQPGNAIADVAKGYVSLVNAPYVYGSQWAASKTGSPELQKGAQLFAAGWAGNQSYGISPAVLSGNWNQIRDEKVMQTKAAAIGGAAAYAGTETGSTTAGLQAGAATTSAISSYDETGKLNVAAFRGLGGALGVDNEYLSAALSAIEQATNVPVSTSNPYVYATGALGGYSSGYDSSYLDPKDSGPGLLFFSAIAASAFLILASKGRK